MMMMRECAQQGRRALGYGKLFTALLRKEQFDFSPYHSIVLESTIDEEKVTAMTKGERTRRAQKEEEEESQGSDSEEEDSDSGAVGRVIDVQLIVLELLRGVDGELKGMRADIQSLGTRVLAVERRIARLEESIVAKAETEVEAETEGWGEAEEVGAGGETGGEPTVAEGTDVLATGVVHQDELRDDTGEAGVGLAEVADTTMPVQEDELDDS